MSLPARLLLFLLLCAACCVTTQSQTAKKETTASVSGKVTIKGKPAPHIVVGMRLPYSSRYSSTYKAATNEDGVFRINNVPSGSYLIAPIAPGMIVSNMEKPSGIPIVVDEGDNIEGVAFELVRGGAITGKVTDGDGHPLIEVPVTLMPVDQSNRYFPMFGGQTDDRGIYRIFGVQAGRYKVMVGDFGGAQPPGLPPFAVTYYPDTQSQNKAAIVEVGEGGEASNIDIKIGGAVPVFTVSGRVVDENGKPVPNVQIGLSMIMTTPNGSGSYGQDIPVKSDRVGEFRMKNIRAGKYELSVYYGEGEDLRPQGPTAFEVVDSDLTNVILNVTRGAQVSGVLVLEGLKGPQLSELISQAWVYINGKNPNNPMEISGGSVRVNPDGRFVSSGLGPGTVTFGAGSGNKRFTIVRIERDGVVQPKAIPLQSGEHLSGFRLIANYASGSIKGTVKIINGTLPSGSRMTLQIVSPGQMELGVNVIEPDARGRFLLESVAAGTYELIASVYIPDRRGRQPSAKQTVTVTDDVVSEVVLTLDLSLPNP